VANERAKSTPGPSTPGGRRTADRKSPTRKSNRRSASPKLSPTTSGTNGKAVSGTNGKAATPAIKPMPKTKLSAAELEQFKEMLLEKRRQLAGDVDSMANEALGKNRSTAAGDLSMMPIHMADIGTDNYEQEFTIGLMEGEQETLKEIDAALLRIKNGTYGVCEATHKQILKQRLRAKPWARFCIKHKRSEEQGKRR